MSKVTLVYSGGLDSTVLLYQLLADRNSVFAVTFHYGQRHSKEVVCSRQICSDLGVEHRVMDIPIIYGSSLVGDGEIPHGHYEDESMRGTVVPNRNMIMLAYATGIAISNGSEFVAYGCHVGDRAIYHDCRPDFVSAIGSAISLCDFRTVKLLAPFIGLDKVEIVRIGLKLGVPFDKTWTCYEGGDVPCEKCGACVERSEAFSKQDIK